MAKSFRRNLKAVSPVIATIIIVAITIVMAIAVAYWMLGLGGAFTRYEKLEFASCYATKSGSNFVINLVVKNSGSAAATIDLIFFNGVPDTHVTGANVAAFKGKTIEPGKNVTGIITVPVGTAGNVTFTSGMSLELMIQTVAGKQYPKVVVLP